MLSRSDLGSDCHAQHRIVLHIASGGSNIAGNNDSVLVDMARDLYQRYGMKFYNYILDDGQNSSTIF